MSALNIEQGKALAPLTTLQVGGAAQYFVECEKRAQVLDALAFADDKGLGVTILGGGSNVVIADRGIEGLVIKINTRGIAETRADDTLIVNAEAGENWDALVQHVVNEGYAGVECLSGIPGLVGATPIQNVGAYGQEVAQTIGTVDVFDRLTKQSVTMRAQACAFSYRDSVFKRQRDRYVVLGVTFRLTRACSVPTYKELNQRLSERGLEITAPNVRQTVIELRRAKSMIVDAADNNHRSVGSFFLNPNLTKEAFSALEARVLQQNKQADEMPRFANADGTVKVLAAWLIENAGIKKGFQDGRVGISTRHSLAIVNLGGANAEDIVRLAKHVRSRVWDVFGVNLAVEPTLINLALV